ncbi:MAG: hypothetical protein KDA38_05520 [Planctomycetales bacterium]|nr:hypothetical protein [Planctomycetales bacterium]
MNQTSNTSHPTGGALCESARDVNTSTASLRAMRRQMLEEMEPAIHVRHASLSNRVVVGDIRSAALA